MLLQDILCLHHQYLATKHGHLLYLLHINGKYHLTVLTCMAQGQHVTCITYCILQQSARAVCGLCHIIEVSDTLNHRNSTTPDVYTCMAQLYLSLSETAPLPLDRIHLSMQSTELVRKYPASAPQPQQRQHEAMAEARKPKLHHQQLHLHELQQNQLQVIMTVELRQKWK